MSHASQVAAAADRFRNHALAAILLTFFVGDAGVVYLLKFQAAGADYSCFWAGVKALAQPDRLYDFAYVSSLQGWPLGPGNLRPFIYPPSALLLFVPFASLPYWTGYGAWVAASYGLLAWAGRRMGAPWWMALFPVIWLVAYAGQVTFVVGGLVAAALTFRHRPMVAGVLLGVAAAVKPQFLLFIPLALLLERQWRTLSAMGLSGLALCLASAAIWGVETWQAWLAALPRFHADVVLANPSLMHDGITPYAMLANHGLPGAWAFVLAPLAVWLVWGAIRRTKSPADRLIAIFGATILVSPYAMNYAAALFAPAVAAYLARVEDRLWLVYAAVACLYTAGLPFGVTPVLVALSLLGVTWARGGYGPLRSRISEAYARRITAKSARSWSAGRQLLEP